MFAYQNKAIEILIDNKEMYNSKLTLCWIQLGELSASSETQQKTFECEWYVPDLKVSSNKCRFHSLEGVDLLPDGKNWRRKPCNLVKNWNLKDKWQFRFYSGLELAVNWNIFLFNQLLSSAPRWHLKIDVLRLFTSLSNHFLQTTKWTLNTENTLINLTDFND